MALAAVAKRRSVVASSDDNISKTQQMVYLSTQGNISGLRMKMIAMKMRHAGTVKDIKRYSMVNEAMEPADSLALVAGERRNSVAGSPGMQRLAALWSILWHPFSLLLFATPAAILAWYLQWGATWIFWLNLVAMIPLAKILGDATEEFADAIHNDTLSGLLNATLGNVVEMILTVQTLRQGLLGVVKATLLGSILSNLLLVLGSAFFLGGLSNSSELTGTYHVIHKRIPIESDGEQGQGGCITFEKEQMFPVKGALVNMAMHLLSIMTIALPTMMSQQSKNNSIGLPISRLGACFIMCSYVAYILFHLVTHKEMLAKDEGRDGEDDDDEDEDSKSTSLGVPGSLILMFLTTVLIGVSSELMVEAMQEVVEKANISPDFIGVVLLPFAGNACEHASALRFAMVDRPGLSIAIAVGSSTQIALLVVPFAVIVGWFIDQPMDLNFGTQNVAILFLSALVVLAVVLDGRSNWLKGFLLCNAYAFTSILFWYSEPFKG